MNDSKPCRPSGRNERLRRVRPLRTDCISFPLTPALSLGEREARSPSLQNTRDWICPTSAEQIRNAEFVFPLPEGEGQGEGKRDVRKTNAALSPVVVKLLESSGSAGGIRRPL